MVIPEKSTSNSTVDISRRNERDRLLAVNAEFSRFFCRYLRDNPRSPAAEYLRKRNIPQDIADKFSIGAAPDSWSACRDYGRSLGFTDADMLTAGILRKNEEKQRIFDQFKGRLTFTIENEQGKPVGFSARTLEAKPLDGRKYVNTPETPVFHKGWLLYALPQARQGIGRLKQAILCEGQLDAIAFHRGGFDCAVAPLGTAFTPDQARIIRRYTHKLILAFDADNAGKKAVLRAAEILLPLSVELQILQIPGGKDPDELFSNGGTPALTAALENTIGWLDVLRDVLPEKFDLSSPVGRSQAAGFVASFLKLVSNQVELEVYISQASKMLGISENAMTAEVSALMANQRSSAVKTVQTQSVPAPVPHSPRRNDANAALQTLLDLALQSIDAGRILSELLPPDLLSNDNVLEKALNMAVNAALNDEMESLTGDLQNLLLESPSPEISRILVRPATYSDSQRDKALKQAVSELLRIKSGQNQFLLLEKLRSAISESEKMEILAALQKLKS